MRQCGNVEVQQRQVDLEKIFSKFGGFLLITIIRIINNNNKTIILKGGTTHSVK